METCSRRDTALALLRLGLGLGAFVGVVAIAAWRFGPELERAGRWFVERLGAPGMALGSFLADGVHFPVPPQFYLLAAVADGSSRTAALASVLFGSALGGLAAFSLGRTRVGARVAAKLLRSSRVHVEGLLARSGVRGVLLASVMPVSYWVLCTLAGALRLPWRAYAVLAVMRVPRLVLSYALIVATWHASR